MSGFFLFHVCRRTIFRSQCSTNLVSAYGLGLIFDVSTEDARLPSRHSGGVPGPSPGAHWSGKVVRHPSSSQSIDSQSDSDPEFSLATHDDLRPNFSIGGGKLNGINAIHVPGFTPSITNALNAYRPCLPPSTLLVAHVSDPKVAVIFLPDAASSSCTLQKNVLVECLEALELDGVAQAYIAIRKSENEPEGYHMTPLLKTLMFLGFELLSADANYLDLNCLKTNYHLLVTNLRD
ncbi:Fibrillin 2 [Fasciola hepatica]|uniref:Fibrillin 2 n=1 Tax=Fasciola hepatica TaxID=6192 RepID=A0A4E0R4Q1_FASHE|nr:Fibrillin 2 [Fasciola hepatica]